MKTIQNHLRNLTDPGGLKRPSSALCEFNALLDNWLTLGNDLWGRPWPLAAPCKCTAVSDKPGKKYSAVSRIFLLILTITVDEIAKSFI